MFDATAPNREASGKTIETAADGYGLRQMSGAWPVDRAIVAARCRRVCVRPGSRIGRGRTSRARHGEIYAAVPKVCVH